MLKESALCPDIFKVIITDFDLTITNKERHIDFYLYCIRF